MEQEQKLKYWKRKWELDDDLIYKKAGINQAAFVSSKICGNLLKTHGFVVSTHYSKVMRTAVYFRKSGTALNSMRCNFLRLETQCRDSRRV